MKKSSASRVTSVNVPSGPPGGRWQKRIRERQLFAKTAQELHSLRRFKFSNTMRPPIGMVFILMALCWLAGYISAVVMTNPKPPFAP